MQWNCPHCGITLAVPYDTLGTGWSFSRCYKCGGFALIRRAELNIIKVDKAPPGEKVILPEAGADPIYGMLGEDALSKLNKLNNRGKGDKPTVRPARPVNPPPIPMSIQKFNQAEQLSISRNADNSYSQNESLHTEDDPVTQETHVPRRKEEPSRGVPIKKRQIPFGIIMAATLAIGSAFYLYLEGQSIYHRVRHVAYQPQPKAEKEVATSVEQASTLPPPSIEKNKPPQEEMAKNDSQVNLRPLITDQLKESAMAPVKAAAFLNTPSPSAPLVQVKLKHASLHSGPGTEFPVIGIANPDVNYLIADWKDRWFKIALTAGNLASEVGWIRNDLVQVLPSNFGRDTVPNINPLRK